MERDARMRADDLFHMRPRAGPFDVADDIAIRIQYANFGEGDLCLRASLNRTSGRNTEGAWWSLPSTIGQAMCARSMFSSMIDQIRLSQPTDSTGRPAAFHSG